MTARLVLVSMVAALGITLPTWSEIHRGVMAVHSWTATQLAAWDAPARSNPDAIVLMAPPASRLSAFEPIVADDRASGLADDLNRAAEGLDLPAKPAMVSRRSGDEVRERPTVAPPRPEFPAVPAIDALESRLVVELLSEGADSARQARPSQSPGSTRRSRPVVLPAVCRFTASLTTTRPDPRAFASPSHAGASPVVVGATADPIEPRPDPESGLAWELNRSADGIDVPLGGPTRVAFSRPDFVPIEPEANLDMGLADELNRASEGFTLVDGPHSQDPSSAPESGSRPRPSRSGPDPIRPPSRPGPSTDVAHAMQLTREAVHAWMNVMSAPSRLHLSAR